MTSIYSYEGLNNYVDAADIDTLAPSYMIIPIHHYLWVLSIFLVFVIFYVFIRNYFSMSPTFINFISKELGFLGFRIKRQYRSWKIFAFLNGISFVYLFIISTGLINTGNYFVDFMISFFFPIFFAFSIALPIIWGLIYDGYVVYPRRRIRVQLNPRFNMFKRKPIESNVIVINMKSKKVCSKSNVEGAQLFESISNRRWLQKRGRSLFPMPFKGRSLHFYERSTPLNFKNNFLNLVSALREWDVARR